MGKKILNDFSLRTADFSSVKNHPDVAFFNKHFAMNLNVGPFRQNFVKAGQPYRFVEGRIAWVTAGYAEIELTLSQLRIEKGDIILLAPETIVELKSQSPDFTLIGAIVEEIPIDGNIIIHASEEDWQETLRMARLLWDIATRPPFRKEVIRNLSAAIVSDIQFIHSRNAEQQPSRHLSRKEEIFSKFRKLVNDNCCSQRNIGFYADRLALTPHYLSTLVAKVSGQTVMQWINRATLVQAKVLLKNKEILVYEVADRLNFPSQSAFGLFFKRETGLTPREYQNLE